MHMPSPTSRPLEHRLNQVLDYIDGHLGQNLNLDCLAALAHLSRYHFLRRFQQWSAEAPHAYVRRRRLETGASQLLYSSDSVAAIAQNCGFDTADGFARAFRQHFGLSPSRWRDRQRGMAAASSQGPVAGQNGPVRIVRLPTARVAYTRHFGPYDEDSAAQWSQLDAWCRQHNLPPSPRFGMGLDDPDITAPEKCRYDVCVEVPGDFVAPAGMPIKTIAGGAHAVLRFIGPRVLSKDAWHRLLHEGVLYGRYKAAARPCFERYESNRLDDCVEAQDCELCLPLEPQMAL
ncbi:helix-turn-helix domain-containing protein [Rugamonas sp. FT107W]|uniref:Helix-turn-helix domain-containing protein n=1 Tax=Duganella vulcania TaxID=2692166 RepID=A0A845HJX9_9BURK|nr:GyrI-like domain-containing protein [Duganella vulcania]MYN17723.1 helix-turn-helix domain-containing protein [Duganella vulcania]